MDTGARQVDVAIIGAGAAGLMCAIAAGRRGRRVLVMDHANKVGKKILMSGGGRCNFTNLHTTPEHFISANPHFVKSALSRYSPWDFIGLVEKHQVPYHEKKLGQLFCDRSSKDIVRILLAECAAAGVEVLTDCPVTVEQLGPPHRLHTGHGQVQCESLVIATGGYSIPRMGATGYGFDFARQLGLAVQPTRAALVPVTLEGRKLRQLADLSGVSLDTETSADGVAFRENILFTHKGLSGPAILQASSYWEAGKPMDIDLFPDLDIAEHLREARRERPRVELKTVLSDLLTRRVAQRLCELWLESKPLDQMSAADIDQVERTCKPWRIWPSGTEGYRTAEVTLGGVDTGGLSSRTMECRDHPGLYFIGEVVDVTGHLGGHNFQWAWASGHAAGQHV
ncbi:putative Rossmann fold flavoprotein [Natronocella acetinitrilica]|uniref:Rossmann fold flavoprotein n=1 Tax=Natronocella acetinitrilica TaxID=414046 RepID=A0AAE3G8R4_9GAMM|nr:NAD(P)/FAD-dependent oxidoreductase [Natronocella acetinitrilica]MCP1677108.1 putative Rossmann fold flavoprotein [Natronocella acetinitrilica]